MEATTIPRDRALRPHTATAQAARRAPFPPRKRNPQRDPSSRPPSRKSAGPRACAGRPHAGPSLRFCLRLRTSKRPRLVAGPRGAWIAYRGRHALLLATENALIAWGSADPCCCGAGVLALCRRGWDCSPPLLLLRVSMGLRHVHFPRLGLSMLLPRAWLAVWLRSRIAIEGAWMVAVSIHTLSLGDEAVDVEP
ncbi:uncharacterized protein K452DRAFT_16123 [Aplosporella prunicola CBS 121167]|uniref:Uncharacterized protein n=1 Tax=Aplosporella prunicola CBS 121167 TaxID=1176127 RepID=A0A6A6AW64_9PEZI|nr:uncharacterized protein K452DRAFT_16123 [Aplosporella prunicola CBS 121167]KAF2135498.1 hypothetical protein K452DRAFT_16123 [Aplosporella prunicola CBS 121167]